MYMCIQGILSRSEFHFIHFVHLNIFTPYKNQPGKICAGQTSLMKCIDGEDEGFVCMLVYHYIYVCKLHKTFETQLEHQILNKFHSNTFVN
jgi:hypothetical protein